MKLKYVISLCCSLMVITSCKLQKDVQSPTSTIDTLLQNKIDTLLAATLSEHKATSGKVVIMETSTGYIKAMTGLEQEDTLHPLRSANDFCTPLPTQLKQVATVLAALETGKISCSDTIDVGDGIYVTKSDTIRDHNSLRGGYGKITIEQVIELNSCVGEAKISNGVFGDRKSEYENAIRQIGYGKPDSIRGLECTPATYTATQRVSPIRLLAFYNAIANYGCMMYPQLYKDSVNVVNSQIASKANIYSIRQALEKTITEGIGKHAYTDKTKVAGRGGTVLTDDSKNPTYIMDFCGYFPADNPQYTVLVILQKRELPASGNISAAELFRKVVDSME